MLPRTVARRTSDVDVGAWTEPVTNDDIVGDRGDPADSQGGSDRCGLLGVAGNLAGECDGSVIDRDTDVVVVDV